MQYNIAEALLVAHFMVPDKKIGAFRGRLRHLRDLGVPKIGKPGTGARIDYTRENVIHMALALHLGDSGLPPVDAAKFADEIVKNTLRHVERTGATDFFVAVTHGELVTGRSRVGLTLDEITEGLKMQLAVVHIVNVARVVGQIDKNIAVFAKAAKKQGVPLPL